jgi:transcriptional regulator GlxA family with amidase domain
LTRVVAVVASSGAQLLDITGPAEIFARCPRAQENSVRNETAPYRVVILSTLSHLRLETSSGVVLEADARIEDWRGSIDTLLVAGGIGVETGPPDEALARWLRRRASTTRRVGSVCTGAFALARAGLLDGRRATTHWAWCGMLAAQFPRIAVESDPIYIKDGKIYTSAGVTAGMDLALALVEEDQGPKVALKVARDVVLYLRRPGSQSQFSAPLAAQMSERAPIRELQAWMAVNSHLRLRIERLAERVGMSARHFARVFEHDVGMTPARYLDRLRVDAACLHLTESSHTLERVAKICGYSSEDIMRRSFRRALRINPEDFRARFRTQSQATSANGGNR